MARGLSQFPTGTRLDRDALLPRQSLEANPKTSGENVVIFRAAMPARSARHNQAAVHTKWSGNQNPILFGFRKVNSAWQCVAASDELTPGTINQNPIPPPIRK